MDLEKPNYIVPDYMPVVYDKLPQPPSHREAIVNSCVFVHQTLHQVGHGAGPTALHGCPCAVTCNRGSLLVCFLTSVSISLSPPFPAPILPKAFPPVLTDAVFGPEPSSPRGLHCFCEGPDWSLALPS